MVYRGNPELVHIPDGARADLGKELSEYVDNRIRGFVGYNRFLCPGCYMVAGFHMMVKLAEDNGQSLSELGRTMSAAFAELERGNMTNESINVMLDPTDEEV